MIVGIFRIGLRDLGGGTIKIFNLSPKWPVAEPGAGAFGDKKPDAAANGHQTFVLKALVRFRDGEWVGLLFRCERPNRWKWISVPVLSGKDCIGNRLAKSDVNGFFVAGAKRHAVLIQHCAQRVNPQAGPIAVQSEQDRAAAVPRARVLANRCR